MRKQHCQLTLTYHLLTKSCYNSTHIKLIFIKHSVHLENVLRHKTM